MASPEAVTAQSTSACEVAASVLPLQVADVKLGMSWHVERLEDLISSISNGLTAQQSKNGIGVPVTRIETIGDDYIDGTRVGYVASVSDWDIEKFRLQPGDILFSHINSEPQIGRTVVYEGSPELLLHGMNLLRLRVRLSDVSATWLDYALKFYRVRGVFAALASRAVGQSSINQGKLKALPIPVPPIAEQHAIAHILGTVQHAIQTRQRELELERERKAVFMQHLFTKGTRGESTKQTEIGEMPESWRIVQLESLLQEPLKNGYSAPEAASGVGVRTLTLSAVTNNEFSLANTKVTSADVNRVGDIWLRAGDLFIERANTQELVGLAALYQGPDNFAIYPDLLTRVRLNESRVHSYFALKYLLSSPCRQYFRRNARGTAGNMPKVDHSTIRNTPMPLPPLAEQSEIVTVGRACEARLSGLRREVSLLEELFHALLEELMSGRLSALPLVRATQVGTFV